MIEIDSATVAAAAPAETPSPFHAGETEVQIRAGVRERAETFGRRGIRDFMPDQHRDFFAQLPLFFIGAADAEDRPWASLLTGEKGFITSPDPRRLIVRAEPAKGDPLAGALGEGAALGGLGIELPTRRRNRVNGRLSRDGMAGEGFILQVDQSFGNCAQYIQARAVEPRAVAEAAFDPEPAPRLAGRAAEIIAAADTFFVATRQSGAGGTRQRGFDVSHRGGRPGFVRIEDEGTLTWPDFPGNAFFNTLGNLALSPEAGLLFPDFASGDLLHLSGRGEILWEPSRAEPAGLDTGRRVRFTLTRGLLRRRALPFRFDFLNFAPQLRGS